VSKKAATKNANTIATPPPRGMGDACELRAFGTSIRFLCNAYPRIKPVAIKATENAVSATKMMLKVIGGALSNNPQRLDTIDLLPASPLTPKMA
jgi:hypothetical protein